MQPKQCQEVFADLHCLPPSSPSDTEQPPETAANRLGECTFCALVPQKRRHPKSHSIKDEKRQLPLKQDVLLVDADFTMFIICAVVKYQS